MEKTKANAEAEKLTTVKTKVEKVVLAKAAEKDETINSLKEEIQKEKTEKEKWYTMLFRKFTIKIGGKQVEVNKGLTDAYIEKSTQLAEWENRNGDELISLGSSYKRYRVQNWKDYLASGHADFSTLLDSTLIEISSLNSETFSVTTSGKTKVQIFSAITTEVKDITKRDNFARSLLSALAGFNFETVFNEKYDFFSGIFQYLIKDYNNAGGGKYAEYYTPREIATVMAMLLLENNKEYKGVTCYDPSAGTGTLLMALAHQIGEDRCSIYSQDISEKSSEMLRLNLILNNLVGSLPNVVQGNTLTEPFHKENDGTLKKFDFVVSNPPFKLDFPEYQQKLASDGVRFWAGIPNKVKKVDPKKTTMAIYTCFIQHVINSLKSTGRGAIVVPTGFITSKNGVEKIFLSAL